MASPAPITAATKQLNTYVGTYALYDLNLKIPNDEGILWLVPSGQKRVRLVPVSEDEFLLDGSSGASLSSVSTPSSRAAGRSARIPRSCSRR